ncbi:hypothetical protein TNCV_3357001 [Trichonephila clavipes]|nr:hypothetical protein TNCV_3357001 [Trichonephila clavipes]
MGTPKRGTTSRLTGAGSLLPPVYSEAWAKGTDKEIVFSPTSEYEATSRHNSANVSVPPPVHHFSPMDFQRLISGSSIQTRSASLCADALKTDTVTRNLPILLLGGRSTKLITSTPKRSKKLRSQKTLFLFNLFRETSLNILNSQ